VLPALPKATYLTATTKNASLFETTLHTSYMKNLSIILSFLLLAACTGSKHFTKLGQKQEAAGLVREASENYYNALQRKRDNIDAQLGMKKTGQLVLNEMLNDFSKSKNFGTSKEAVYSFHKARDYRDKIKGVGVDLLLADFYATDYESAKGTYLMQLYDEGTSLLEEQKFTEAESRFSEIRKLDPDYKDAKDLGDIAYLEPLYSEGKKSFAVGYYRKAYTNFEKVIQRKLDYKDAKAMKDESLKKGTFTVALLPFENATGQQGMDAKMNAYTLEAVTAIKDPFLKVVDRENMQAILQEQKLQLSGVINESTAVEVGNLVGAQAILTGTVLSFDQNNGRIKTSTRDAYESYRVKKVNQETGQEYFETKYKPVKYTEYYNTNSCAVTFQYKLISLKTGEIMKTEIIEKSLMDEVLYAKYDGDGKSLVPAGQTGPNLAEREKNSLQGLLQGRQTLKAPGELSNDLFNQVSLKMSSEIGSIFQSVIQ